MEPEITPDETYEEWEEGRRVRMDEIALDIAAALRRWGFEKGRDYGSIVPGPEVGTLYVAGVTVESVALAIALLLSVSVPEDLRKVGLNAPDESYEVQEFTVLACGSRTDLETFCNRPLAP